MIIKIHCQNCKEYILQAETSKLDRPLVGAMFTIRPDREWYAFEGDAVDMDLVCPMCAWTFHENQKLLYQRPVKGLNRAYPYIPPVKTLHEAFPDKIEGHLGLVDGKTPEEIAQAAAAEKSKESIEKHSDSFTGGNVTPMERETGKRKPPGPRKSLEERQEAIKEKTKAKAKKKRQKRARQGVKNRKKRLKKENASNLPQG